MRKLHSNTFKTQRISTLKQKSKQMVGQINAMVETFPCEDRKGCGYWHEHLPVGQGFIDSPHTLKSTRRLCIQTLINAGQRLIKIKPKLPVKTRVVVLISLPTLWDSQIIVFFGNDYFSTFFDRNSDTRKWTQIAKNRDVIQEWKYIYPKN